MPLQNRVDPWGTLNAHPAKISKMMGNRGILHDAERRIVKHWVGKSWVACDPGYKNIVRKPLFQTGRYSELFFLDEATAYAAGHRPCAFCQRDNFNTFKKLWAIAHLAGESTSTFSIKEIDEQLHRERTTRGGKKIVFTAQLSSLPNGTMIEVNQTAILLHHGRQLKWSFEGYAPATTVHPSDQVNVLTPHSIVKLLDQGLKPIVHASADA
jgi:hypothetical protein